MGAKPPSWTSEIQTGAEPFWKDKKKLSPPPGQISEYAPDLHNFSVEDLVSVNIRLEILGKL